MDKFCQLCQDSYVENIKLFLAWNKIQPACEKCRDKWTARWAK